jgi:LuxR family maltose regulon positive regulatory protein
VLSRQPADTQKFLWRTSILARFCAEVCDELTQDGASTQILRDLEQANLFIVPLDNQRRWFRYHHLFAEFLRLRLHENEPEIIPELYRQAIDWFEQTGLLREALQYALQGKAYERAADLIETLAPEILSQDNHILVIQWCEALPAKLREQRPSLCAYLGGAYVVAGQIEAASQCFDTAEVNFDRLNAEDVDTLRGYICAHRSYILIMQGEYALSIDYAQQALSLLPADETALRARTVAYLGAAYNYCGRLQHAKNAYQEAITIARKIGSLPLAQFSYCGLGETLREEGRLTKALEVYHQLLAYAQDLTGDMAPPLIGNAVFEIGVIYCERYDLDAALEQVQNGVVLCREWQQEVELAIGLLELAEIRRLRGEYVEAAAAIHDARQVVAEISPWASDIAEGIAARLSLSRGDFAAVVRWAEAAGLTDEACGLGYERFPECPALIRMHVQSGNPQKALALTEKLMERDRGVGRMGRVLDLLVLQFEALDALGETDQALQVLAEAVVLASPEKHLRPFVDEGPRLVPYLQKLPPSPFCNRLLGIFGEQVEPHLSTSQTQTTLVESLNERECEILRMMAVGRSNREIGDELYLSVNTIRWYASQIYTKLRVKNRSAAVAQARELGLIA